MSEVVKKKTVRRVKAASPMPSGAGSAPCGHEGNCTAMGCRVRYVGPVSHMTDHHAFVAARASSHIWMAAVVTSLALVVTGAVAFNSASAEQSKRAQILSQQNANRDDISKLQEQLNRIERNTKQSLEALTKGQKPATQQEMMKKVMEDSSQ